MPACMQAIRLWGCAIAGLLLIVFLPPAPRLAAAGPATYYVAPNGRDTNPGTRNAPFQSVKKASSVVKAGDTVTNNLVYNNYGEGINPSLTKGGLIAGNILHDNFVNNIYLDNATDFRVEGNFVYTTNDQQFYNNGAPASAIMIANETYNLTNPSANLVVVNNILTGARFNFGYGDYDRGGGLQNLVFANNTLVNATQAAIHMDGNPNHANLVFANNIVTQSDSSAKMLDSWNGTAGYANMAFHHNLWFGGDRSSVAGAGDTNADPLFVNPGGMQPTDYQLRSGSPAVDAGVALPAVKGDFWGACRPGGGAYDLGRRRQAPPTCRIL